MSSALHKKNIHKTNNEEDSLSSSSDSGDDYLTVRRGQSQRRGEGVGGRTTQREAMIRKKLLESFYGGSEGKEEDNRSRMSDDEDDDDDDSTDPGSNPKNTVDDMDTPHFNAVEHTQRHVWTTAVHPLLDIEESLACQVRTLDSRLQTLVYENYSRFIDATDAIRSIGVSVQQANDGNLSSLQGSMDKIQTTSRAVEAAVGPLRDQVVEKTRVHRLLQRLDTLLKLPSTLRQQIQGGKYRLATKSYVSAYSILSKHSTGFESLQRIETECHDIMTQLLQDSSRKLYHWSGGFVPSLKQKSSEDVEEEEKEDSECDDAVEGEGVVPLLFEDNEDESPLPDPPGTIVEIMESAATPVLVLQSHSTLLLRTGLTLEDCQDMALNACLRFLERILDMHHIELQEQSIMTKSTTTTTTTTTSSGSSGGDEPESALHLIPTKALDCILEVVTLYAMSFHNDQEETGPPTMSAARNDKLTLFVSSSFHLFLTHVRSELLEQAMLQQQHASQARAAAKKVIQTKTSHSATTTTDSKHSTSQDRRHRKTPSEHATNDEMMRLADVEAQAEAESDHYDEQIATSMATLLLSVRQLASGLTLVPHGAVPPEIASSLVEQTVGLTETMVRRRVDQKFYSLRLRVVEDCFAPFCQAMKELNEADEEEEDQPPALLGSVQLASVALSDSLQLVDDTVRSILANVDDEKTQSENHEDGTVMMTMDDSMLRDAVRHSTVRFTKWLASAMEVLAGYESSTDPTHTMVAPLVRMGQHPNSDEDIVRPYGDQKKNSPSKNNKVVSDAMDDSSNVSVGDATDEAVEDALLEMMANRDKAMTQQQQDMVLLAIAEMCRVAERSVADQIRQSISTHGGGGTPGSTAGTTRKSSAGGTLLGDSLFTVDESQKTKRSTNDPVSKRFRLAASRILTLYAMNIGHDAANLLGSSLPDLLHAHSPVGPRSTVSSVLELFKATSQDCADLFGGPRRAGPIPESLEDEYTSLTFSRMNMMGSSGGGGGSHHKNNNSRSGLVFDVERMFAEKVVIYPHPNELIMTLDSQQRNAVVTLMGKVAFQGWIERSRMVRFSVGGYRQIKMDVEFIKWYLPHFVKEESMWDGSNALTSLTSLLTEVALTVRDRCIDRDRLRQEVEETNVARESIRRYLSSHPSTTSPAAPSFCFVEDY